jgi:hypothetical protein
MGATVDDDDTVETASENSEKSTDEEHVEAKKSKEEAPLPDVRNLQKLAKNGQYKEVLEALGIEVDGTKVPSDRFAKFRRMQKAEKDKLEARDKQVTARESAVQQKIQAVLKDYDGLSKAKRAWDDGDVVGAIEAAFGESLENISDRAMKQKLASDPELFKLKHKLEAKEQAEKQAQEAAQKAAAQREQAQQEARYIDTLQAALEESDDRIIAKASKRPDFKRTVFNAQMHAYRTEGVELSPDEAASRVMQTIREAHLSWSEVFGPSGSVSTVSTVEAGTSPLITNRAGKSPEKPRSPKGVSPVRAAATPEKPASDLSEEELLAKYKKIWAREAAQARLNAE